MGTIAPQASAERGHERAGGVPPPPKGPGGPVDLSRESLPAAPSEESSTPDLRSSLKAFASSPNFNTFVPVAQSLIELAELPHLAKQELTALFSAARPREELLMLSDSFLGYPPLSKRLPGREDAASWAQDRSRYPELFTVLGIVSALTKLAASDRMLTQSVISSEPARASGAERADLRKRLLNGYETALLPGGSAFMNLIEEEAKDKNSLAVTRILKGYLVPIFEVDHGIKVGIFKRLGYALSEEAISPELADLAEGGLNPDQSRILNRFRSRGSPRVTKTELKPGVTLKEILPPSSIDRNFIENVLNARAETDEKIIFLSSAIAAAETVHEDAYYGLLERVPRGTRVSGDVLASGWSALKEAMKKQSVEVYSEGESLPYDIPLYLNALSKVSDIQNKGYFGLSKRTLATACQASKGWSELHYSFKNRFNGYVDWLYELALQRQSSE